MVTVKVDSQSRIKLPDAEPGQIYAVKNNGTSITITLVKKAEPESGKVKFIKKDGFTVGHTDKKVSPKAIRKLLSSFP